MHKLFAGIRHYDLKSGNKKTGESIRLLNDSAVQIPAGNGPGVWEFNHYTKAYNRHQDHVNIKTKLTGGNSDRSAIIIRYDFDSYSANSYLLLPGCAYNGNRFESRKIPYSPKLTEPTDISPQQGLIVSDIPRLDNSGKPSVIRDRAGALSVPVVGLYFPVPGKSVFVQFPVQGQAGDHGIEFHEERNPDQGSLHITIPVVREGTRYHICNNSFKSSDQGFDFSDGFSCELNLIISCYSTSNMEAFYDHFFNIRQQINPPTFPDPTFPLSECYQIITGKFNRENWVEKSGYYSVGMRENFLQDWQTGWTGGMISTFPILQSGDKLSQDRVRQNFDWFFSNGISPSGLFWDSGESGTKWYGGDIRNSHTADWHLARKSSDAIYWILRQFIWMESAGITVKDEWQNGLRRPIDAFCKIWLSNNQIGQFINNRTGEIIVGGSVSAGLLVAGLSLASEYYGHPEYIEIAEQISGYFYVSYLSEGITCGGPGDALQCPDSESAFAILESFVTLFEHTGKEQWLSAARHTANYCSSWVMNYNYHFPTESMLGKLGIRTLGTVFANVQNKHGAPGICINSGSALLRLARYTGNYRYASLLQEITRHIPQLLSHPDRKVGKMSEGWLTERVSTTDWFEGIGEIMEGSTWAETTLMLSYTELPGVYINLAEEVVLCFDQVEARLDTHENRVTIENPTEYVATFYLATDRSGENGIGSQPEMKSLELNPFSNLTINLI